MKNKNQESLLPSFKDGNKDEPRYALLDYESFDML